MGEKYKKNNVIIEDNVIYILNAGISVYVKTADICAMTGKSNQWIGQLTSQGTLNKKATKYGQLYEIRENIKSYTDLLEERADKKKDIKFIESEKEKLEAELSIKKSKAIVAALEAKELQGKMHRSDDVADMTEDLVYTIRGMLLALPGRLAVDVIHAQNSPEAAEIIKKEVYAIMEELSNYQYDPRKYEERVRERQKWELDITEKTEISI